MTATYWNQWDLSDTNDFFGKEHLWYTEEDEEEEDNECEIIEEDCCYACMESLGLSNADFM